MTTLILSSLILIVAFVAGIFVGVKHAEKGRAIKGVFKS